MKNYDNEVKGLVWGTLVCIICVLMIVAGFTSGEERIYFESLGVFCLGISTYWIWRE